MDLKAIVDGAPLFLLVAARALALIEVAPLLSGDGIPQAAKIGLAGLASYAVFPAVQAAGYAVPGWGLEWVLLLCGEALIGILMGFFLLIVYSAFSGVGQLFSLQMGFGASEVYDPLAQVEIPLIGQFLNLIAMFAFLATGGFQKIFITGVWKSFQALKAADLASRRDDLLSFLLSSLSSVFQQCLIMALPILGTLFVISVAMGLLSKAAPQMNLMSEGFSISIIAAFLIMLAAVPFLMEAFSRMLDNGFSLLGTAYAARAAGGGASP